MSEDLQRIHAIIHGRVQGVSFRYYTTQKATELGVTGWVLNRADGTVEVIAEGQQNALHALESWLHEGSPAARVERVTVDWQAASGDYDTFKTVYRSS